jgi:uncharacterized protein
MSSRTPRRPAAEQVLILDVSDLVGRVGSQRGVRDTVAAPEDFGTALLTIPAGRDVTIDVSLESVSDGIYVHGTASAEVSGECSRCLDPLTLDGRVDLQELFSYPGKLPEGIEPEEVVTLDEDDRLDLTGLVRDAFALDLPESPLCRPGCLGLCPQCGFRMEDDPEHHHEVLDTRWAALQGLLADSDDTSAPDDGTAGGARA